MNPLHFYFRYYFTCVCSLCKNPSHERLLFSSRCFDKNCDGSVLVDEAFQQKDKEIDLEEFTPTCDKCGHADFPEDYKENRCAIQEKMVQFLDSVGVVDNDNAEQVIQQCLELNKQAQKYLSQTHVYMVRLYDVCYDANIMLSQWKSALEYVEKSLKGYRLLLHRLHPNLAIQLFRIGKLRLFLDDFKGAIEILKETQEILILTHGNEHDLYYTLEKLLYEAQSEYERS